VAERRLRWTARAATQEVGMSDDASESLARARTLYDGRLSPERTRQMRGLLQTASSEASALAATSTLCDYLNRWNNATRTHVNKAEAAAQQALKADQTLHLGHYAMGFVYRTRGQHTESLKAFETTLEHAPLFARAHAQKGEALVYLGRPEEGIAAVEEAIRLSPRSASLGMFYWIMGRARFFMGDDAAAIPLLQRSIRLWPTLWYNRLYLVASYEMAGNNAAARRTLGTFHEAFPGYTLRTVAANERATPSAHEFVVAGRRRFHDALRRAGMK
jgi:adenylate cyclase